MTASDADADDLAQEAFVRAWRAIHTFRSESTFRTWLFGVAINVIRTHRSKLHRLRRVFASPPPEPDRDPLDRVAAHDDVEKTMAMRQAIDRALAGLPVDLRE